MISCTGWRLVLDKCSWYFLVNFYSKVIGFKALFRAPFMMAGEAAHVVLSGKRTPGHGRREMRGQPEISAGPWRTVCRRQGNARVFSCLPVEDEEEPWGKSCPGALDFTGKQRCLGVGRGLRVLLSLLVALQDCQAILTGAAQHGINE